MLLIANNIYQIAPCVCVCVYGQFLLMTMSLLCYFEDASGYLDERFNQGAVLMLTCIAFKEITTSYVPKTSHLNYIVSLLEFFRNGKIKLQLNVTIYN